MSSQSVITCDVCKLIIENHPGQPNQLVDMSDYGVHAHISCFGLLSAANLVELLNLDTITFGAQRYVLACNLRTFRRVCWEERQEDKEK